MMLWIGVRCIPRRWGAANPHRPTISRTTPRILQRVLAMDPSLLIERRSSAGCEEVYRRGDRVAYVTIFRAAVKPRIRKIRKRTRNRKAKNFAIANDAPATDVKPKSAATRPIKRKNRASFSIPGLLPARQEC